MRRAAVSLILVAGTAHAGPYFRLDGGLGYLYTKNLEDEPFDSARGAGWEAALAYGAAVSDRVSIYVEGTAMMVSGRGSTTLFGPGFGAAYKIDDKTRAFGELSFCIFGLEYRSDEPTTYTALKAWRSPALIVGGSYRIEGYIHGHAKLIVGSIDDTGSYGFHALVIGAAVGISVGTR